MLQLSRTTRNPRRTTRTRTTVASCWSSTRWAWTPDTPRTRCATSALILRTRLHRSTGDEARSTYDAAEPLHGHRCRSSVGPPGQREPRTAATTSAAHYVDYLAHHPSTARRIATKLCQRFVSDTPPSALVERPSRRAYPHNDTAIAPVLRALFNSKPFQRSNGAEGAPPDAGRRLDAPDPRGASRTPGPAIDGTGGLDCWRG